MSKSRASKINGYRSAVSKRMMFTRWESEAKRNERNTKAKCN